MGNGREWNIKDRHTERQTDTQKDRQTTPTQKDGQIDKEHTQIDKQKDRQIDRRLLTDKISFSKYFLKRLVLCVLYHIITL